MTLIFRITMLSIFVLVSCRGTTSKKPPIHLFQNMDDVGRLDPQSPNLANYYVGDSLVYINPNKMSMIVPVEGTVSRENDDKNVSSKYLADKSLIETGKYANGDYIEKIPSKYNVNKEFIERGKQRYGIYCSVCHGAVGDGKGIVTNNRYSWHRNMLPANYHNPDDVNMDDWDKDGYIYSVIAYGVGNMNGYEHQISVDDRWKIVAYMRYLLQAYRDKMMIDLKLMPTIEAQLLSDEFELLVIMDKYDVKNLVQDFFSKTNMVKVQKIIGVDSNIPDGLWGEGSKRKWLKWKNERTNK
tara:strand:- start:8533 stop:9426 length:894 start_codon:yes stop_codon:yes gene_type:complete